MEGRVLMPWESKTVEELEKFVLSAQDNISFSALCRKYGITRKTGYKWLKKTLLKCLFLTWAANHLMFPTEPGGYRAFNSVAAFEKSGLGCKKAQRCSWKGRAWHSIGQNSEQYFKQVWLHFCWRSPLSTKLLSDLKRIGATKCGKPIQGSIQDGR